MKLFVYTLTPIIFLAGCSIQQTTLHTKDSTEPNNSPTTTDTVAVKNISLVAQKETALDTQTEIASDSNTQTQTDIQMVSLPEITLQAPHHYPIDITQTSFLTFDTYVTDREKNLITELLKQNTQDSLSQTEINTQILQYNGRYLFERTRINDFDILIHKRDFFGLIGDIYEAHIYLGNGKVLVLSDELNHSRLDETLRTISKN